MSLLKTRCGGGLPRSPREGAVPPSIPPKGGSAPWDPRTGGGIPPTPLLRAGWPRRDRPPSCLRQERKASYCSWAETRERAPMTHTARASASGPKRDVKFFAKLSFKKAVKKAGERGVLGRLGCRRPGRTGRRGSPQVPGCGGRSQRPGAPGQRADLPCG